MSNITVSDSFVKPYYIEALGENGLTAHDIAKALNVEPRSVIEKLKRDKWHSGVIQEWRTVVYTMTNDSNMLTFESYALNTAAAKAFVSRWVNHIGDAYLQFLFQCEDDVLYRVPLMEEELTFYRNDNQRLAQIAKRSLAQTQKDPATKRSNKFDCPFLHFALDCKMMVIWQPAKKEDVDQWQWEAAMAFHSLKVFKKLRTKMHEKYQFCAEVILSKFSEQERIQKRPEIEQLIKDMIFKEQTQLFKEHQLLLEEDLKEKGKLPELPSEKSEWDV